MNAKIREKFLNYHGRYNFIGLVELIDNIDVEIIDAELHGALGFATPKRVYVNLNRFGSDYDLMTLQYVIILELKRLVLMKY